MHHETSVSDPTDKKRYAIIEITRWSRCVPLCILPKMPSTMLDDLPKLIKLSRNT